ncbi:MAG TPA: hypothetical protein VHH36_09215 [Candidatus Thermoplasmatota archaeon]|nr:hypothetical protein [Candidatus Thermoplasmatota archaeon]
MKTPILAAFAISIAALMTAPTVVAGPSPSTNWFSLINSTHTDPTDMVVLVVPAAYYTNGLVTNTSWIGTQAACDEPGTRAALEAINYWQWIIGQNTGAWSQLNYVTWTTKVLGCNALPADVANAKIVVNTAMVADPSPFIFHLGLGAPTYPASYWIDSTRGHDICTVWNTGLGVERGDVSNIRLRNLVIHEFGHCLGVGHTGTSLGLDHCDSSGTCYTSHPTDVMSSVHGNSRQCISNLNIQSLAEGYWWLTAAGAAWQAHDGETYMLKTAYSTTCMPNGMKLF